VTRTLSFAIIAANKAREVGTKGSDMKDVDVGILETMTARLNRFL
jgi:hypothetical protein